MCPHTKVMGRYNKETQITHCNSSSETPSGALEGCGEGEGAGEGAADAVDGLFFAELVLVVVVGARLVGLFSLAMLFLADLFSITLQTGS